MSYAPFLVTLSLAILTSCSNPPSASKPQEAWDQANDPLNFDPAWERRFDALPQQGSLTKRPWSDTYWPSNQGGIANRWLQPGTDSFNYIPPSYAQVAQMSSNELSLLSPAEKFDIANGNFNYPTVQRERSRTSPTQPDWFGICHGWAPAALQFEEPKPTLITSVNGINVPFGSSDVKALLSYYAGEIERPAAPHIGSPCFYSTATYPGAADLPECRDANAGAFHLALANLIGMRNQGFIADITRDAEIWNQPVHGFQSRVLGVQGPSFGAAPGTVREVVVQTTINYTVEVKPNWSALNGTTGQRNGSKTYIYNVELNAYGQVIGGQWQTVDRPDYVWTQYPPAYNVPEWNNLWNIYQRSIQ